MKHFARWMICLGLLLNPIIFIAFLASGAIVSPTFFLFSLPCYPLSLLLIHLARNQINSKCCFYQIQDPIWWKIIKTILMPIVSAGALIMFHLITTTYRKMNEAIEDSTGFSLSSIFRTFIGFLIYAVSGIVIYMITTAVFDDNAASDVTVALLIFGGVVWLVSHILWDILDLADKESDGFIMFKNIAFFVLGVLCIFMGIIMFINERNEELTYGNMVGSSCLVLAPLCIHFVYYAVNRLGRVPQSKMTYFWGPIAMTIAYIYSMLVASLAQNKMAWIIIFYILNILVYVAVIFFIGFPFRATDGEYRTVYRNIAKEKRKAMAASAGSSYSHSSAPSSSSGSSSQSDYKIRDIAYKVSNKFGPFSSIHVSAITSINNIKVYPKTTNTKNITYTLNCTLYVDLHGKDPTDAELTISRAKQDFADKINELGQKIINETIHQLDQQNIDLPDCEIEVIPDDIKEDIRY